MQHVASEPTRGRHLCPLSRLMIVALFGIALLLLPAAAGAVDDISFFRIGAGSTTGTYFQVAGILASAISKPTGTRDCDHGGTCGVPGLAAVAQATQGSLENILAVASGQIESALTQSDTAYWAFTGTRPPSRRCHASADAAHNAPANAPGKNPTPMANLRAVAGLYQESLHIIVRADSTLQTVADLRGKIVALGEPESGTLADARLILDAAGIGECDIKARYLSLSAAAEALQRGDIDAFFFVAGAPVSAIRDIAVSVPLRLLPVDGQIAERLIRKSPIFSADKIEGGVYPGIDRDVTTVSVTALWIVAADAPDDLIYTITKALWRNAARHVLDSGHPVAKRIRRDTALAGVTIPLHAGAARYYREAGMTLPTALDPSPPVR